MLPRTWQFHRGSNATSSNLLKTWCRKRDFEPPDPIITNDVLYQLSYCGISQA